MRASPLKSALGARLADKTRAELVAARAETGDRLRAEAGYLANLAERERLLADREVELTRLSLAVRELEEECARLREAGQVADATITGLQLQRDTLTARHNAALDLAEERRLHLEERGCEAENLRAALAEEVQRSAQLRTELQAREIALREAERRAATLENDIALSPHQARRGHCRGGSLPTRDKPAGGLSETLPAMIAGSRKSVLILGKLPEKCPSRHAKKRFLGLAAFRNMGDALRSFLGWAGGLVRDLTREGQPMQTGTVKWFNTQKGYGFIQPDAGGPDVFVHITAVQRSGLATLNEGQKVSYELMTDRRTGKTAADRLRPVE